MKSGRKPKHHIAADGNQIKGLAYDAKSERWRIIEGNRFFRAANEAEAIEKFRRLTGSEARRRYRDYSLAELLPQLPNLLALPEAWAEIGTIIRARPKWTAEHSGIEQLAYFTDAKPPEQLPSFKHLEQAWTDHANVSSKEKRTVLAAWRTFTHDSAAEGLRSITPELVVKFRDQVWSSDLAGKTQQHLFNRIRRLLTFAKSRAISVQAISLAVENLKLLTPSKTTVNLDPRPIEREQFKALLEVATGDDRAMLLLMLNCALYLQEVVTLEWSDIKGDCLVTNREKKGKCIRASVLWPETIEALGTIKRQGDFIFRSYSGACLTVSGAGKRWRKLRAAAKQPEVTASQLRDGALTAAVAENVSEQLTKLFAGHRCGMADHYVKRNPKMVKPATDAVYHAYFG